jgi:uncharacterized membrane protein HdeD (DUF308 family)
MMHKMTQRVDAVREQVVEALWNVDICAFRVVGIALLGAGVFVCLFPTMLMHVLQFLGILAALAGAGILLALDWREREAKKMQDDAT